MMKVVVEFGVRGGRYFDNLVCDSARKGADLAYRLAYVSGRDAQKRDDFLVSRGQPRISWQSATHFVSVSVLDGVARGPAACKLWVKP